MLSRGLLHLAKASCPFLRIREAIPGWQYRESVDTPVHMGWIELVTPVKTARSSARRHRYMNTQEALGFPTLRGRLRSTGFVVQTGSTLMD